MYGRILGGVHLSGREVINVVHVAAPGHLDEG
jgi:hypothetical protein